MGRSLSKEDCLAIASTCFNRNELQKTDCYVYKLLYKNGWIDEAFPVRFKKRNSKWSDEELKEIASQYQSKNEFKWGNYNAYHRARVRDCFEDICSHMKTLRGCDKDVLYVLKIDGFDNLYKIGITSLRCKNSRFKALKNTSGFTFDFLHKVEVNDAEKIEQKFLSLGEIPVLPSFSGYTEFRYLSNEDLEIISKTLEEGL